MVNVVEHDNEGRTLSSWSANEFDLHLSESAATGHKPPDPLDVKGGRIAAAGAKMNLMMAFDLFLSRIPDRQFVEENRKEILVVVDVERGSADAVLTERRLSTLDPVEGRTLLSLPARSVVH